MNLEAGSFLDFFKGPRKILPPNVREWLSQYGDMQIVDIKICRKPIQEHLNILLNTLSLGEFNKRRKELNYDKLYHLFMLFTVQKGTFLIEKNEVINIQRHSLDKETEYMPIKLNKYITPNIMINNAWKYQGDSFPLYNAKNNNCQVFIMSLLKANGLGDKKVYEFVKQDSEYLVTGLLEKISDITIDLAMRFHHMIYGTGNNTSIY